MTRTLRLVALAALLAPACHVLGIAQEPCRVDGDCPDGDVCNQAANPRVCIPGPGPSHTAEGEGSLGEGEGTHAGEGEGAHAGEGEGATSGEGEGTHAGEGEGTTSGGEGEGATSGGEGEGEGQACDADGGWALTQSISYQCCFVFGQPQVDRFIDGFLIGNTDTAAETHPFDNTAVFLDGSAQCPVSLNFTTTLFGSCNETYTLQGTFSDANNFTGTYTMQFSGSDCCDCVDQSANVIAQRL